MIRAFTFVLLATVLVVPMAPADDAWVTNRGGMTVNRFDTTTNLEQAANSPIAVGTTPVDMAQNNADGADPGRVYVVNNGSNDITVIDRGDFSVVQTLTVNFEALRKVAFLIEGKTVETLAGHVDVRTPLTRLDTRAFPMGEESLLPTAPQPSKP